LAEEPEKYEQKNVGSLWKDAAQNPKNKWDPFQQMFFFTHSAYAQGQHENVEYLNLWAKSGKILEIFLRILSSRIHY
jgi:hypothetical protein